MSITSITSITNMTIHVLFGQRKQDYEGQYAPVALDVITEFDLEEIGDKYKEEQIKKYSTNYYKGEYTSLKFIPVEVNQEKINAILMDKKPTLEGKT